MDINGCMEVVYCCDRFDNVFGGGLWKDFWSFWLERTIECSDLNEMYGNLEDRALWIGLED